MKKGKWSKEEDNLIKNHIEKYGIGRSWQGLSNALGLQRCGRSCRSRWLNYLRPGLKHGHFTPAEDRIICEMYNKRGSCWSVIAAELPGRTDLAVKNYWNCTLKKRSFPRAARSAGARRRVHRRSGSTSSDAASPDLALVVYDEESIGTAATAPDLALVVYSEERTSTARAPDPALVVHDEERTSTATVPDLALVVYNEEESATAGSSSSNAGGVSVDRPILAVPSPSPPVQAPPVLDAAGNAANEEPIAVVPVSGPVIRIEPPSPPRPPAADQTGEMDVGCAPMSPLPLGLMDPDLPCMAMAMDQMDLRPIAGFDDITASSRASMADLDVATMAGSW